jgi:hypothetical protein
MAKQRVRVIVADSPIAVWLTRAEVEGALEELNRPRFQPGDIVRRVDSCLSSRFVVVGEGTRAALAKAFHIKASDLVVVGLHDGSCYNGKPESYERAEK